MEPLEVIQIWELEKKKKFQHRKGHFFCIINPCSLPYRLIPPRHRHRHAGLSSRRWAASLEVGSSRNFPSRMTCLFFLFQMPVPHRPHSARGSEARMSATLGKGRRFDAPAIRADRHRFRTQRSACGSESLEGAHVSAGGG